MTVLVGAVNGVLFCGEESAQSQFLAVGCGVGIVPVVETVDTEFHG
jgi:hypothetical protein